MQNETAPTQQKSTYTAARSLPSQRLDPRAKTLWRISGVVEAAFTVPVAAGVVFVLQAVTRLPTLVTLLPLALVLLTAIIAIFIAPSVRWRRWRYEIRDTEVDLQRGVIYITRTLVPLARVQHVDTQQGPFERWLGLATVVFFTAGGSHKIPALDSGAAREVAGRIGDLAKVARDEPV
ncbi:MAG: PH domain-containing protein [Chloroflexota bacterium]|nr:PH domain-containing protein [Chloroflexota bacterium]